MDKENWKEISEEVNKVPFKKQKSFYADYLRLYLRLRYFPSLEDFPMAVRYKRLSPAVSNYIHFYLLQAEGSPERFE
jgi:hypothetical protein